MIWFLVRLTTSLATFVSRIWLSDACRFSTPTPRYWTVLSQRVLLERAQIGAKLRHLPDGFVRDLDARCWRRSPSSRRPSDRLLPATLVLPRLVVRMLPRLVLTV